VSGCCESAVVNAPVAVALVEDEPATRSALAERLVATGRFRVAWEAGTLADARDRLRVQPPEVAIVDLGLPDGSGLDLIAEAHALSPPVLVLVLTVFGDERKLIRAIEHGARGYLLKDEPVIGLVEAIEQIRTGGAPISPAIARHLISRLLPPTAAAGSAPLTAREVEVLSLSAKGYNHAEIARLLEISANTVASYTRRIYEKLEVHSRAEAVFEATRLGLLAEPQG
jgi:DNA-binding NarL/FixJ family response regulator